MKLSLIYLFAIVHCKLLVRRETESEDTEVVQSQTETPSEVVPNDEITEAAPPSEPDNQDAESNEELTPENLENAGNEDQAAGDDSAAAGGADGADGTATDETTSEEDTADGGDTAGGDTAQEGDTAAQTDNTTADGGEGDAENSDMKMMLSSIFVFILMILN